MSFSDKRLPVVLVVIVLLVVLVTYDLQEPPSGPHSGLPPVDTTQYARLVEFRDAARAAGVVFGLPEWPQTPGQVHRTIDGAIQASNRLLDEIAGIEPVFASFRNTVQAYETAMYPALDAIGPISVITETHPDKAMRDAGREAASYASNVGDAMGYTARPCFKPHRDSNAAAIHRETADIGWCPHRGPDQ